MISLAALAKSIRRSSVVNNLSAPVPRGFRYQAVAKKSQSLLVGSGIASRSMNFPAAIIVGGVPARLPAAPRRIQMSH